MLPQARWNSYWGKVLCAGQANRVPMPIPPLPGVCNWARDSTSLSLDFLVRQMGTIKLPCILSSVMCFKVISNVNYLNAEQLASAVITVNIIAITSITPGVLHSSEECLIRLAHSQTKC